MIVPNIDADLLTIEIFDKDTHTSDDFMGKLSINIGQSFGVTGVKDAWYPVTPRGEIRLRTKYAFLSFGCVFTMVCHYFLYYGTSPKVHS